MSHSVAPPTTRQNGSTKIAKWAAEAAVTAQASSVPMTAIAIRFAQSCARVIVVPKPAAVPLQTGSGSSIFATRWDSTTPRPGGGR